jgi:hypothetical protein
MMVILTLQIAILALLIGSGIFFWIRFRSLENKFTTFLPATKDIPQKKSGHKEASSILEQREEYFRINAFFLKMLSEKKSKSNYKRLLKEYMELGTRLYFFASENTIRKFLEFKHLSSFVEGSVHEHKIVLLWFAEFNLLLRNDLGLDTNPALIKDYLNILLTYWEENELEEKELDELKECLSKSMDNYYSVYNIGTSLN